MIILEIIILAIIICVAAIIDYRYYKKAAAERYKIVRMIANSNKNIYPIKNCVNCRFGVKQIKEDNVYVCALTGAFINGDNDIKPETYYCSEFDKRY